MLHVNGTNEDLIASLRAISDKEAFKIGHHRLGRAAYVAKNYKLAFVHALIADDAKDNIELITDLSRIMLSTAKAERMFGTAKMQLHNGVEALPKLQQTLGIDTASGKQIDANSQEILISHFFLATLYRLRGNEADAAPHIRFIEQKADDSHCNDTELAQHLSGEYHAERNRVTLLAAGQRIPRLEPHRFNTIYLQQNGERVNAYWYDDEDKLNSDELERTTPLLSFPAVGEKPIILTRNDNCELVNQVACLCCMSQSPFSLLPTDIALTYLKKLKPAEEDKASPATPHSTTVISPDVTAAATTTAIITGGDPEVKDDSLTKTMTRHRSPTLASSISIPRFHSRRTPSIHAEVVGVTDVDLADRRSTPASAPASISPLTAVTEITEITGDTIPKVATAKKGPTTHPRKAPPAGAAAFSTVQPTRVTLHKGHHTRAASVIPVSANMTHAAMFTGAATHPTGPTAGAAALTRSASVSAKFHRRGQSVVVNQGSTLPPSAANHTEATARETTPVVSPPAMGGATVTA